MTAEVGQRVWYHPGADEPAGTEGDSPLAGIVAYVSGKHTVNLGVLDIYGHMYSRLDVPFVEEGIVPPEGAWCQAIDEVTAPAIVEPEVEEPEEEPPRRKYQRRR